MQPNDLSKLPAPPQGQQGVTFASLQHLPPPPQGQQGMTLDQIKNQSQPPQQTQFQQMPLLTSTQGDTTGGFATALKDHMVGFGKDLVSTARTLTGGLQNAGQQFLSDVTGTPRTQVNATSGFQSLDDSTPSGSAVNAMLQPKSRAEQVGGVLSTVAQLGAGFTDGTAEKLLVKGKSALTGAYDSYKTGKAAQATADANAKIADMIAPNPTVREARIAQQEGRFVEGKEPTRFKSGTPDKLAYSDKTANSTRTIVRKIPGAANMTPSELYTAVENDISTTAKNLKPQMQRTIIKPQTIEKINTDWEAVKKTQMAEAPATEEANVAKRQKKFEAIMQKSGNISQNDLWETRIEYDKSIPNNVKQATIDSPPDIQLQHEEWLQNRDILNRAINDTKLGMGQTSQKAFSDMTDMYEAKTSLQSKAKVVTKPKPSQASQFIKNNPVKSAVGGYVAGKLYENTNLPGSGLLRNILP